MLRKLFHSTAGAPAGNESARGIVVRWFDIALAALLLACVAASLLPRSSGALSIKMDMAVATSAGGQIFYAVDERFSEAQSVRFALVADGAFRRYQASVPFLGPGMRIRIDPGSTSGQVLVRSIDLQRNGARTTLSGTALPDLKVLNVERDASRTDALVLQSTGEDPIFSFRVPDGFDRESLSIALSKFSLLLAGLCALVLASRHGRRIAAMFLAFVRRHPVALVLLVLMLIWLGARILGLGCASRTCTSGRAVEYGLLLSFAWAGMAAVGAAVLLLASRRGWATPRVAPYLWIIVGQTALFFYIYVRSLAATVVPVTRWEIAALAVAAAVYVYTRRRQLLPLLESRSARLWALIQLCVLVAVSMWVADRELPRAVMLSSDPDIHAYFAHQLARAGGVPWRQEGWVDGAFHYPAGTAVLTHVWASLSGLDVRNALTALPLMQTLLAALLLAELATAFKRDVILKAIVLCMAVAITLAAFAFPFYEQYSHMEGLGRQFSILWFAFIPTLLFAREHVGLNSRWLAMVLMALGLFCLTVLNPASIMVPCALVGAYVAREALIGRRIAIAVLAPPLAGALALLDPYYAAMVFGDGSTAAGKVPVSGLAVMSFPDIAAAWKAALMDTGQLFRLVVEFPAGSSMPLFAVLLVSVCAVLASAGARLRLRSNLALVVILLAILWLMTGLFSALRGDVRYYLLHPYFQFSIVQNKALLLALLSLLAVVMVADRYRQRLRAGLVGAALVLLALMVVRPVQPHRLEPRFAYCGSLGCPAPSDADVIGKMLDDERFQRADGPTRVLVPNAVHQLGMERWLFPLAGARLLSQETDTPLAFYYYQGDDDYTTEAYESHVCRTFDRQWLKSQNVRYVFLPADRSTGCMANMEQLLQTERIVLSTGNSYLLELRP